MGDSRIKDVSSLLAAFFDEEKIKKGGRYAEFFGSWKTVAGERLAAHSQIIDIDRGFLIIEAEHPGWIQLLQLRQAELLRALAFRFPELGLRGIQFRLGSGRTQPGILDTDVGRNHAPGSGHDPEPRGSVSASDEDAHLLALEAVSDPALRSMLAGLKEAIEGKGK